MAQTGSAEIRVSVAGDGSVAELCIPENFNPDSVNLELAIALLQQSGVVITETVRAAAKEALANATPGIASRAVVATLKRPVHGNDGWIEWLVDGLALDETSAPDDGEPTPAQDEDGDDCEATSHYDRSVFVMVEAGAPIARVHPPTLGEDGCDVRGRSLSAKQGKPAPLKHDDSVSVNSSGTITAEVNGAVTRSGHSLSVRSLLDIPESVDFSTGNITFDGSVRIRREIKDLFVVSCKGSLEIGGLIEAATLNCDGDLLARGGMAGRERGSIRCGGNVHGRYFDAAKLDVRGNLSFERELINCTTRVHGQIESPRGSIIGGEVSVAGGVLVANLGSRGGAKTRVVLGTVPELQARLDEIEHLMIELDQRGRRGAAELRRLSEPGRKLNADQIERQTELIFYKQSAASQRRKLEEARDAILAKIAEIAVVDVRIERMLFHGVRLVVGGVECRITKDTKGPLRILRAGDGTPMYKIGSDGQPRRLIELGEARLVENEAA